MRLLLRQQELVRDGEMVEGGSCTNPLCYLVLGDLWSGWVTKSSIQPFPEDLTTLTASNKYNQALIQEALDEAKLVMDVTDDTGRRFFDRMCVGTRLMITIWVLLRS